MKEKQAPRKVFVLENNQYIALTYEEFECRKAHDPAYGSKWFLPVQGCLVETDRPHYSAFYRDKERQKYLNKVERDLGLLSIDAFDSDAYGTTAYHAEDVADLLAHEECLRKLQKALRTLNPEERKLIDLHFYQDFSQADIAARLGVSQQAISKRLRKICEKMKKLLEN